MSLRINTNIDAMNAQRNLSNTSDQLALSMERLSSGLRINNAKDDVAGLSIANKFRLETRGLTMAEQNVSQATSLLQVGQGGADTIETIVERLKELATSAASDNTDSDGRAAINSEASSLLSEIDRIANDTKYGSTQLLTGSVTMTFQIGSGNISAQDQITVNLTQGITSTNLGINAINLTTLGGAQSAIDSITNALASVNYALGQIGAAQSRLTFASSNLAVSVQNLSASESTIRDVDMAQEMTNFTKSQILEQAGTAMLAQANSAPQAVLSLFK